jgi:YjbE family integral membrane protein
VLRIAFAGITTQLLQIVGLLLAGGILLLWVCWKMWREMQRTHALPSNHLAAHAGGVATMAIVPQKTLMQATTQIVIADVSMSLDNVLAVAGAAREHPYLLIFGLLLSVAMMGVAASFIAGLLQRHRWITYVGLAIILYVALDMIYRGAEEVLPLAKAAVVG